LELIALLRKNASLAFKPTNKQNVSKPVCTLEIFFDVAGNNYKNCLKLKSILISVKTYSCDACVHPSPFALNQGCFVS
jgi:hypothetical protein